MSGSRKHCDKCRVILDLSLQLRRPTGVGVLTRRVSMVDVFLGCKVGALQLLRSTLYVPGRNRFLHYAFLTRWHKTVRLLLVLLAQQFSRARRPINTGSLVTLLFPRGTMMGVTFYSVLPVFCSSNGLLRFSWITFVSSFWLSFVSSLCVRRIMARFDRRLPCGQCSSRRRGETVISCLSLHDSCYSRGRGFLGLVGIGAS